MKLYKVLAQKVDAYNRCVETGNSDWQVKWSDEIKELVNHLPSGSGIDNGVKIDLDKSTGEKLVFDFAYHFMNDCGMYCGWKDYALTVKPSLQFDIDLHITGSDRNGIKDYLYDVFQTALMQDVEEYVNNAK